MERVAYNEDASFDLAAWNALVVPEPNLMDRTATLIARRRAIAQEAYCWDFAVSGAFINELCLLVEQTRVEYEGNNIVVHGGWRMK